MPRSNNACVMDLKILTAVILSTFRLMFTIAFISLQQTSAYYQNSTNLNCEPATWPQFYAMGRIDRNLFLQETDQILCSNCSYICTVDYLSDVINFGNILPLETARLFINCTSATVSHLPSGSFKYFKNLTLLGFFYCNFEYDININDWLQGILIKTLFLHDSTISINKTTVTFAETLYDNPELELANLSVNDLTTLPTLLLCKWASLKKLWLYNNHISELSFLYSPCSNITKHALPLQSLEELSLSHNYITTVTQELLTSFPNLNSLHLQDNKIHTVVTEWPATRSSPSFIRKLILSNNKLRNLEFCKLLRHVVALHVDGNQLECSAHHLELRDCVSLMDLKLQNVSLINCGSLWKAISSTQLSVMYYSNNYENIFDFQQLPKTLLILHLQHSHLKTLTDVNTVSSELSLVLLNLSQNDLTHLANFSFPPKLISLYLDFNDISRIGPGVFTECTALSFIALNDNRLTHISGVFSRLSKLGILYLQNNNIIKFDYSMIPGSLYYLNLSNNAITEVTDDERVMQNLHLRYLNLSGNHFVTLNQDSFAPSIFSLDLSNCEVDSIDANAFRNFNFKYYVIVKNFTAHNVQNPYLTQNPLPSTPVSSQETANCNGTFKCSCECTKSNGNSRRLQTCCNTYNTTSLFKRYPYFEFTLSLSHLTYCMIEISCSDLCRRVHFYKNSFQYNPMNNLYCNTTIDNMHIFHSATPAQRGKKFLTQRGLILSHMNISALKDGAFEDFQQLLVLNVGSNFLHEIPRNAFRNLSTLTKLCIAKNKLIRISDYAFKDLQSLIFLELNDNRLENLTNYSFIGLDFLRRLNLSNNNINVLPKYTFGYLSSLQQLDLSRNQIHQIQHMSFGGLQNLRQLNLNNNKVRVLEDFGFSEMIALEELFLECNVIKNVSNYTFDGLLNLQVLSLYSNQISNIESNSFEVTVSLRKLLLHHNRLVQWSLHLPNSLTNLTVSQNRFPCNCKGFFKVRDELLKIPKNVHRDIDKDQCGIQNSDGSYHSNKSFIDEECTDENQTEYVPYISLPASVAPATIALVSLCLITALYIYRLEVQVLVYSKFNVRLWTQKSDDANKLYDAFISYSDKDRNFISDQLMTTLEKKYRICIHERDFLVGAYITNTIIEVVENSCRTLIILSPNFVKSQWCLYEFKTAHYQSLKDKCSRLIIIILQDVDINQLSKELRAYMRTNTFLRWEDPLFWEKLMYSMPDTYLKDVNA